MQLDELKFEEKKDVPLERSLCRQVMYEDYSRHSVTNKVVPYSPRKSGYPSISPLEADLMELMGDALGG